MSRILPAFRRRLLAVLFFRNLITYTAIGLLFWGVAVLALRVGGLDHRFRVGPGLSLLLLALPAAWLVARRRVPDDRKLAAILDRDNDVGGLLMSSFETELGPWSDKLGTIRLPVVRWAPRRTLTLAAVATAFAVTALLFPLSAISGPERNRLNIDDQVRRLTTQLDVLEEENLLDVEDVESRKLELDKIQKDADGQGPVKTFDALDHIADRMARKAAEAVEQARKSAETLADAEALAREVRDVAGAMDDSARKSLMDGLARSLEDMLAANKALSDDLKKALAEQAGENGQGDRDGTEGTESASGEQHDAMREALKRMLDENNLQGLSPEMLDRLCEAMAKCQGDNERMCENLQNAGFPIDPEALQKIAEGRESAKEAAREALAELWAECAGADGVGEGEPGEGDGEKSKGSPRFTQKQDWTTDPDTPPEDASYEKEPDEAGAAFKAKVLPPADWEAYRNSQKIGASISAPTSTPDRDPLGAADDRGGAIRETTGGTAASHEHTIHPKHRGPVSRYFEK